MSKLRLKKGHIYRLEYKLQSGNYHWYRWTATMSFLGSDTSGETIWNLRPQAGTQMLSHENILVAEDLGDTQGRSDNRHRLPKSLGRLRRTTA